MRINVTNCLLLAGAAGLFAVFRLPYVVGGEIALMERDALAIVRAIVAERAECSAALQAPATSPVRATALLKLHERCRLLGVLEPDLPQVLAEAKDTMTLASRDYLFLMAQVAAPASAAGDAAPPPAPGIEAWAWPRSPVARARTAFCALPSGVVFTRNLTHRYRGLDRVPEPGTARPRKADAGDEYWGLDGQYWRKHPE